MSHYRPLNFRLKERIYENDDKSIVIFKTRKKQTIKYIAVKTYVKKSYQDNYNIEYEILKDINYPSIIKVLGYAEDKYNFYMEMEFCASGNLSTLIRKNKSNLYLEKVIKMVSTQLLLGLKTLHENGIIHCNLKPSNILIDEYGNVKICDFKKSLKVSTMNASLIKKNKNAMTPCYTAPELFQEEGMYSFKSDLWALGCIMYELAVGQVPFFDDSIGKLITKIINNEVNFNKKELRNYSDDFIDVIKKLLIKEPNERSTWGDIERMPWWDGYFYNSGKEGINDPSSSNKNKSNDNKGIDASKLSKIASQNKREEKQDYNNSKEDELESPDTEFDFISKELEDINLNDNNNNSKLNVINPMTQSKFPMNISVINISKVFKRDRRTYNDINAELIKSSEEELPSIKNFIIHQSDRIIKPIIGNKNIEDIGITSYYKSKLPFNPYKKEILRDMMNNEKELKNVEKYLLQIYTVLEQFANQNDFDNLINLLKYFETIVFDRELANNLINTSFIQQFISFLKNINNEQVRTRCCCIIGYLVRYATIIEVPLDNYEFCDIICNVIKNANDNSDLIKKASATMGEYLFYVATQEETPENKEWNINKKYLNTLLYCLDSPRSEIVKFYTIKTIENICILTKVSKTYFASSDDYLILILNIYLKTNNQELKLSAISTISQLLRHNPSMLKIFLEKCPILTDKNIFLKEPDSIKQYLINCLLNSLVENIINLNYIMPQCDLLIQTLVSSLEKSNNVIKVKMIVLIGMFLVKQDIIIKYGEDIFIKMQKYRMDKNREIHFGIKFFEQLVSSNSPSFIKSFCSHLNKDKIDDIKKYCKLFDIIGLYHKISNSLFTKEFLDTIKNYIKKKLPESSINDELIGNLLDVLIKFSENPFCVELNIDAILKGFLLELIQMTPQIKGDDNLSKTRLICSNIFSIILTDERLYSINNKNEGKTKEIQKLINNLMPSFKTLLKNIDIAEGILSILSLILERDENFISIYKKNGIINFIFDKLKQKEFNNNLNIIKILIIYAESPETTFDEIINIGLINKVNDLIDKSYSEINNNLNNDENDEENSYLDYIFELFYDIILKIGEYKKKKYPKNIKIDLESYNKDFLKKVENIGKNFQLCIKLLGNQKNVNIQEMSCVCIINMLLIFPNMEIKDLNLELKFKSADIPNLLKGLELSCYKIHKKMINILDWIIQFQDDANKILKPYASYITTYLENIINTSAEPDVISTAQNFINNQISRIK